MRICVVQVVLAEEVGKPLFLHARDAEAAFAEVRQYVC